MIQSLQYKYNELIRPDNFIDNFSSLSEFEDWCYTGTIKDLKATLVEFEKYELYEHCIIIKGAIYSLIGSLEVFSSKL
jgi:hypothetical protein